MVARGMRLVVLLWLAAACPALACRIEQRAAVPVDFADGSILVPVVIDGRAAAFVLDTGAERTMVSETAVRDLGLARDEWVATTMHGVGGDVRRRNAVPRMMALGGVPLRRRTVANDLSLTVADLPAEIAGRPISGLLGADLLASFDLDIDLPNRTLRLFDVRDCRGDFIPWRPPHSTIPAVQPVRDVLLLPVTLDGTVLRAQLDTGSATTLILAPGIARLGLAPDPAGPSVRGVGRDSLGTTLHRFHRMQVGSVVETDHTLPLARAFALRVVDMLLGADWLATRRVWVSYATSQVFVGGS